ncbi:MAG: hypothetical protein HRU21_11085, partial [Pseudomonadales bacterium]|nr:hypothetical protein [Pseudomonadales bacterium]
MTVASKRINLVMISLMVTLSACGFDGAQQNTPAIDTAASDSLSPLIQTIFKQAQSVEFNQQGEIYLLMDAERIEEFSDAEQQLTLPTLLEVIYAPENENPSQVNIDWIWTSKALLAHHWTSSQTSELKGEVII